MLDSNISWISAPSPAMGNKGGPESAVAQRLVLLRTAMGYDKAVAFAARVGLDYRRYHNYESGYPLSREAAIALVQAIPGLTLDWLYLGREDGLSFKLGSALRGAGAGAGKAKTGAE